MHAKLRRRFTPTLVSSSPFEPSVDELPRTKLSVFYCRAITPPVDNDQGNLNRPVKKPPQVKQPLVEPISG